MRIAGGRHDLTGVVLSDPGDFKLPEAGIVLARDFETGALVHLDASDRKTRHAYMAKKKETYGKILAGLKSCSVDAVEVSTDGDVADCLARFFRVREKRMR
jgi:hypothetical protein